MDPIKLDLKDSYRVKKEAFVSGNLGDTVLDINKIAWTAITTYQLWKAFRRDDEFKHNGSQYRSLVLEYLILVLPLILVLTAFSDRPITLNVMLYALLGCGKVFGNRSIRSKIAVPAKQTPGYLTNPFHKPFVTVWRAHMMLMTIICILAVDFPAFPRSFGKTESWGTSLMDVGVGSFVFSMGVTSAPSLLKRVGTRQKPPPLLAAARRTWIVFILGLVRLATVKGAEYPEHVTEYGVHWNFFFTLAPLPILGALAERWVSVLGFRSMGLIVTAAHQLLLYMTPLQAYTLSVERPNLLAQNKEGLVSFSGYLAIYLLGFDTGLYVLPPDPSYMHRRKKQNQAPSPNLGKLLNVLFSYAAVWWALFGIFHLVLPKDFAVSRRLANTAYVLWIAAFNVSFLCLYLAVDYFGAKDEHTALVQVAPRLFEAINRNSLAVFLVANMFTGVINMSMQTMYASDNVAVAVLVVYTVSLVCLAVRFKHVRLKL